MLCIETQVGAALHPCGLLSTRRFDSAVFLRLKFEIQLKKLCDIKVSDICVDLHLNDAPETLRKSGYHNVTWGEGSHRSGAMMHFCFSIHRP